MTILGNNIICICRNSAIYKFVIILVNIAKQVEMIVRFSVESLWMTGDGFHNIVCYFGGGVHRKNFLIFRQNFVADA